MTVPETRLQVVFGDLRRAVDDVILKHRVDLDELVTVLDWLRRVADADELDRLRVLFAKTVWQATDGASYAHPETDGASPWEMEGPAHLPGAPLLDSPAVLPMRPDEPGEPLVVSGTVRSTAGEPLGSAVLDVWQIDANNVYSGIATGDFAMPGVTNDAADVPPWNLRARIVADVEGHYEFRTVVPGVESFDFPAGGPLSALTEALRMEGERPVHIHSIVTADGYLPLTTQIYFDGDPRIEDAIEGAVPAGTVRTTTRHDDPGDVHARGLDRPYRGLTYDYALRPAGAGSRAR